MNKYLLAAPVTLLLAACGDPSAEAHDVQWYLDHPDEHRAQTEKCQNDPAKLQNTPACINAEAAADKKATGYGAFKPQSAQ